MTSGRSLKEGAGGLGFPSRLERVNNKAEPGGERGRYLRLPPRPSLRATGPSAHWAGRTVFSEDLKRGHPPLSTDGTGGQARGAQFRLPKTPVLQLPRKGGPRELGAASAPQRGPPGESVAEGKKAREVSGKGREGEAGSGRKRLRRSKERGGWTCEKPRREKLWEKQRSGGRMDR